MTFHVHFVKNNEISVPPDIPCKARVGHKFVLRFCVLYVIFTDVHD